MKRLDEAGVRVNYSWLRENDEGELKHEIEDLIDRGINFVLVDHVEEAMNAAETLGIPRLIPHWDQASPPTDQQPFHCPTTQ